MWQHGRDKQKMSLLKTIKAYFSDELDALFQELEGLSKTERTMLARQFVEDVWKEVKRDYQEEGISRNEAGLGEAIVYIVDHS